MANIKNRYSTIRDDFLKAEAKRLAAEEKLKADHYNDMVKKEKVTADPKQEKLQKQVAEMAQSMIDRGMEGYQDWVSAMAAIMQLFLLSSKLKTGLFTAVANVSKDLLAHTICGPIWNEIKKTLGLSNIPTPKLEFSATVDNGKLISSANIIINDAKHPLSQKAEERFNQGIGEWLEVQGYYLNQEGEYSDSNGRPMQKEDFNGLAMNAESGLVPYIKNRYQMTVDKHSSPHPDNPNTDIPSGDPYPFRP